MTVIERMALAYVREQRPCPEADVPEYASATAEFMLAAVRELRSCVSDDPDLTDSWKSVIHTWLISVQEQAEVSKK